MSSPKRNLVPAKQELCPRKDIPFCRWGVSCCGRLASVESRGPWPLRPSAFTWNVFKVHPFRSIYQSFISFRVWVRSRCLYSLWFVYPLINWWTIGPFPLFRLLGCAGRIVRVCLFVWAHFHFSWVNTEGWN